MSLPTFTQQDTDYILAFVSFYRSLRAQRNTLLLLITESLRQHDALEALRGKSPVPLDAKGTPYLPPGPPKWDILAHADELDRLFCSSNALAGAAFVVVNDLIQSLARRIHYKGTATALSFGPDVNGVHLSALIAASSNCFKHSSEWRRLPWPYNASVRRKHNQEFQSIELLQRALNMQNVRITGCVCNQVLALIWSGDYPHFEADIKSVADAMSRDNGAIVTAAHKVALQAVDRLERAASPPSNEL